MESATPKVLFCKLNRCSFRVFEHNKINFKVLSHQVFFADRRAVLVFGWNLNLDFRDTTLKPLSEFPQPRSQGLLRFQNGGREKTLAHTVMIPTLIGLKIRTFLH